LGVPNVSEYVSILLYNQASPQWVAIPFWIFETESYTIRSAVPKKTHARMKHRIDQQAGNKVMATLVYSRWPTVVILIFGIREFYQLIGHPQNPTPG